MSIRRRRVNGGVNACIRVAVDTSFVECQCTELMLDMSVFADGRQKSVTIAISLERSRKEGFIDHAHSYVYLS